MASYYIRKFKISWSVMEESYENGKRIQKRVPNEAYGMLGFSLAMSLSQAKERASVLNKSNKIDRASQVKAARNLVLHDVIEAKVLPPGLVRDYIEKIKEDTFGSDLHTLKLLAHFQTIQTLLKELNIEPQDLHNHRNRIYKYFVDQKYSLDYSNKLLRILNGFAQFVCRSYKVPHEPIEAPRGKIRETIKDTYFESDDFRGTTEPLTPALLESAKRKLTVNHYNWLYLSIWFGLRATEVDCLKNPVMIRIEKDLDTGVDVLGLYQTKLTSVERDARWKFIPVIYEEQTLGLEIINAGVFSRPTYMALKKAFDIRITLRSGRRGFTDLMLGRDQKLDDIAVWLGHSTIETTWKHYKNKRKVSFTKTKKTA